MTAAVSWRAMLPVILAGATSFAIWKLFSISFTTAFIISMILWAAVFVAAFYLHERADSPPAHLNQTGETPE